MAQQWKPEDEQQFQDLLRRAEQQTRELAKLSPQSPPPAPAVQEPARRAAPAPPSATPARPRAATGFRA